MGCRRDGWLSDLRLAHAVGHPHFRCVREHLLSVHTSWVEATLVKLLSGVRGRMWALTFSPVRIGSDLSELDSRIAQGRVLSPCVRASHC